MGKLFASLVALFLPLAALAQPATLVVSGMVDEPGFEVDAKAVFLASEARGRHTEVAAGKGAWGFTREERMHGAETRGDLRAALAKAVAATKPGESIVVYLTDHGTTPDDYSDPLSAKLVLEGKNKVSHHELLGLLEAAVPSDRPLRLVGSYCFAGALHEVAARLPNACAAASTDFRSVSYSSTLGGDFYTEGFWNAYKRGSFDFDGDGATSLFEAHYAGLYRDTTNTQEGQLSSLAYIDSVQKTGAYDLSFLNTGHWGYYFFLAYRMAPPRTEPEGLTAISNCRVDTARNLEPVAKVITGVESGVRRLAEKATLGMLPDPLRKAYGKALESWGREKPRFEAAVAAFQKESSALKAEWRCLGAEERKRRNAEFTRRFDELRATAQGKLAPLYVSFRLFSDAQKVVAFLEKATPEQKRQFERLAKCEQQPL